jgi:hypothetical protein
MMGLLSFGDYVYIVSFFLWFAVGFCSLLLGKFSNRYYVKLVSRRVFCLSALFLGLTVTLFVFV